MKPVKKAEPEKVVVKSVAAPIQTLSKGIVEGRDDMPFESVQSRQVVPKQIRRVKERKDSLDDHSSESEDDLMEAVQQSRRGRKNEQEEERDRLKAESKAAVKAEADVLR